MWKHLWFPPQLSTVLIFVVDLSNDYCCFCIISVPFSYSNSFPTSHKFLCIRDNYFCIFFLCVFFCSCGEATLCFMWWKTLSLSVPVSLFQLNDTRYRSGQSHPAPISNRLQTLSFPKTTSWKGVPSFGNMLLHLFHEEDGSRARLQFCGPVLSRAIVSILNPLAELNHHLVQPGGWQN